MTKYNSTDVIVSCDEKYFSWLVITLILIKFTIRFVVNFIKMPRKYEVQSLKSLVSKCQIVIL